MEKYREDALMVIMPIKGAMWQWTVSIMIGLILAILIGFSKDTKAIFEDTLELINNAFIAFIAMEVGAYGIFQALLNADVALKIYQKDKDALVDSNRSFLGMILLFWGGIMINIILIIAMRIVEDDWNLTKVWGINVSVATILLFCYYTVVFRIMIEVRNFAINLYKVFRIHNSITLINKMKEDEKDR